MNDVERNRKPLHRYRNTFRASGGVIDKNTEDGLRAWAIRNVMAAKMGTTADDELADLETWEWDTRMRIRTVDALERIADAADAYRLSRHEGLTVGEFLAGVAVSGPNPTIDGQYVMNPEVEFHDGLYANGGVFHDGEGKSWFALDVDQEVKAMSPDELRQLATLFRTSFAGVLDFAADEWEKQLAAGEVTLDDNNKEDEK